MVIDEKRRLGYCQTFTPEYLVSFNLDTAESTVLGLTGSGIGMGQGENIVIDYRGRIWGGWSVTRAWQSSPGVDQYRLYRYDPDKDEIEFFRHGLPHLNNRSGWAHVDGMIAASKRHKIYCGSGEGGLFRIDPDTAAIDPAWRAGASRTDSRFFPWLPMDVCTGLAGVMAMPACSACPLRQKSSRCSAPSVT